MSADPYFTNPHVRARVDAYQARRQALDMETLLANSKERAEATMAVFDDLPLVWRRLAHEHGFHRVLRWRAEGRDPFTLFLDL